MLYLLLNSINYLIFYVLSSGDMNLFMRSLIVDGSINSVDHCIMLHIISILNFAIERISDLKFRLKMAYMIAS